MRYLNKIVFINSAHVRYSEISLDGNVHFTGTQGVGKSTLLRALLFFYNADKLHLGIKQGQRTFDQFYFEISRTEGAGKLDVSGVDTNWYVDYVNFSGFELYDSFPSSDISDTGAFCKLSNPFCISLKPRL